MTDIRFFGDRLRQVSTTTGVGNFVLGAAPLSFFPISSIFAMNVDFAYTAEGLDAGGDLDGQVEMGVGHLNGSGQLVRSLVTRSSNANALVNFTSSSLRVFVALTAEGIEQWRAPPPDLFVATALQTVFALSRAPRSQAITKMYVNGRIQTPATDFTVVGTTLTWLDVGFTLAAGYAIRVEY
jgi:hypothetical protein